MLYNGRELYKIENGDSGAFLKTTLILKATHEFDLELFTGE